MANTTTQLTISLPALIKQLKHHVSEDKKAALEALLMLPSEQPEEQLAIKKQMGELASPDELRAAVNALIEQCKATPAPSEDDTASLDALLGQMSKASLQTSLQTR
mgnify:FL=1|tara:strand:+ start:86 stop:403 length:318 start_codon:yes stop_codon:yes gene_type:complete